MPKGIDISEFQGYFDLAAEAPEFVIIRAGDGNYWDVQALNNARNAEKLNIPYGFYWLTRAWSIAAAEQEATDMINWIHENNLHPTMGLWCDVEAEYDANPSAAVPYVDTFCRTIQDNGYYAGIYCNNWYRKCLYPALKAYDCWIADWDNDPHDDPGYGTMKQYSNSGGVLDLDVCFVPLSTYNLDPQRPSWKKQALDLVLDIRSKVEKLEDLIIEQNH